MPTYLKFGPLLNTILNNKVILNNTYESFFLQVHNTQIKTLYFHLCWEVCYIISIPRLLQHNYLCIFSISTHNPEVTLYTLHMCRAINMDRSPFFSHIYLNFTFFLFFPCILLGIKNTNRNPIKNTNRNHIKIRWRVLQKFPINRLVYWSLYCRNSSVEIRLL